MVISPLNRALFYLPAKLYEFGVKTRIRLYQNNLLTTYRLNTPVISVGNLTFGGTGKTPCVAFIARFLRDEGNDVAILSRGYKRETSGRIEVSNGAFLLCGPREAGDEPFLLAKSCSGVRVVVDQDRYAAGKWLEGHAPVSAFILDDGYQHLRLARDLNLLLIDGTEPLESAQLAPFGRLREPLKGIDRADAVIVTRSDQPFDRSAIETEVAKHSRRHLPIFYAYHEITGARRLNGAGARTNEMIELSGFRSVQIAIVSGIGNPDRLARDLAEAGMTIVLRRDFDDHHQYSAGVFREIVAKARSAGAECIVTTEKDEANMAAEILTGTELPIYAVRIEFRCRDEEALKTLIRNAAGRQP